MVKILLFLICFAIFLDLNTFLEEIGKTLEGVDGASSPQPPLKISF